MITQIAAWVSIVLAAPLGFQQQDPAVQRTEQDTGYDQGITIAPPPDDADIYTKLRYQVPGLEIARQVVDDQLAGDLTETDKKFFRFIQEHLDAVDREQKVELALDDVIQRTLQHSYYISVQGYNPAISTTNIVQAEAVFDAVFFSTANITETNQPTAVALQSTDSSSRIFNTGLSKLVPTGMFIQTEYIVTRQESDDDFAFAIINPSYRNQFSMTFRQPFLRGFGLDYNLSGVNIAKNNKDGSDYQFRREVRDRLAAVERAYWELVGARRSLVIDARLIAEFKRIYDHLYARREFDASPVEISDAKARLDARSAAFIRTKNDVKDAEDNLKNLINDPALNLTDEIEIIPTEFPSADAILVERLSELQSALDHRSEIREAELAIESARIAVGAAKNQTLPRFDATFNYTYDALGASQGDAWENLGDFDFHNYTVGLEFEWPIGNRASRAELRRARLQHSQAMTGLKLTIENIILDVNIAIRELQTSYEQISANLTSVESLADNVRAIEDRAERRDPNQLNRELDARASLANARALLLSSLLRYNFAITGLERAKGTLLEYNNISIVGGDIEQP